MRSSTQTNAVGDGANLMTSKESSKDYFDWLCTHIKYPDNNKSYSELLEVLHEREFVWVIGNDDNRIQDGRDLKRRYFHSKHHANSENQPISVLEVLIGISNRLAFLIDSDAPSCAWELIENLRFHRFSRPVYPYQIDIINETLDKLIWRTYKPNGIGSFFPLRHSKQDQTQVEIWYQMTAYIEENYYPRDS
jgi:hypothetical protein